MADQQKALSVDRGRSSWGAGCFVAFVVTWISVIFVLVGGSVLWTMVLSPVMETLSAPKWVETPCVIHRSEVVQAIDDPEDGQDSLEIEFEYNFEGQQYQSDQFSFSPTSNLSAVEIREISEKYAVGTEQTCFVDPDDPATAVLRAESPEITWMGLFGLVFVVIGLTLAIGTFVASNRKSEIEKSDPFADPPARRTFDVADRSELRSGLARSEEKPGQSEYDEEDLFEEPGPITLKAESHPLMLFFVLLVFGIVWNGIVFMIASERFDDWANLKFKGFEDLFLMPFLIVGIGVLLGAIYAFMASLNPRPVVVLSRQLIPLGGFATANWHFEGGFGSVRKLTLSLIGTEEAVYRRGTDTHTDTNEFYREVLFETDSPSEISSGETEVAVPTDTMHTFKSSNNKIVWVIKLHGEIGLWPDVQMKFPIRVVPHE
ncbi:DUF3592 domain-containing protein [Thalassoglobus sp. JC818]|uniref:DUF3592 domain-containing protein n=1 Tax=Thalassoglobus sp. JC818 TaxID=3232136 RepID=UPI00345922F1